MRLSTLNGPSYGGVSGLRTVSLRIKTKGDVRRSLCTNTCVDDERVGVGQRCEVRSLSFWTNWDGLGLASVLG